MKRIVIVLCVIMLFSVQLNAQTTNVTFLINTALVPDTLQEFSVVQIRGGTAPLTWNDSSGVILTNIGGDYWMGTTAFPTGDTVSFKLYTDSDSDVFSGGGSWEANVGAGNRELIVGANDTTLALQYVNGILHGLDQYYSPFPDDPDMMHVWVRINMQGNQNFNPLTQSVGVRGAAWPDSLGNLSWFASHMLTRESNHANGSDYTGTHFWSGLLYFPKASLTEGQNIEHKFVVMNNSDTPASDPAEWEGIDNRIITIGSDMSDTTLHWSWFSNAPPAGVVGDDTISVSVTVDMTNAIESNSFASGDTLLVALGWGGTGRDVETSDTPVNLQLFRQGFTQTYAGDTTIIGEIGGFLYYQYYRNSVSSENREVYFNFNFPDDTDPLAERRRISPTSGVLEISDEENAITAERRMPVFRNNNILAQDVTVTFTCDIRPAIYQVLAGSVLNDIQGTLDVSNADSIMSWGVYINGEAVGGWQTWNAIGLADWKMFDDGTNGDLTPGDSIYSIQIPYSPDSNDVVGQVYKFGIGGGDNEGGFGNNHVGNIDDSGPTATIATQFGSIDPSFYSAWDYENMIPTSVEREEGAVIPDEFTLKQNYPNPFNPETTISFSIPKAADVRIEIFNVLGQRVGVLVNEKMGRGIYNFKWNGTDNSGNKVASGVYIYRMVAGNMVLIRKMMLIK